MKRKDKVLAYVLEKTSNLKDRDIDIGGGVTALEIAEVLDILRSNASKDLNTLTREGKLDKTETRPVRYYDAAINHYRPLERKVKSFKEYPSDTKDKPKELSAATTDLFQNMIGASGSLTSQISQAKAAIFYPPKGLNTLIEVDGGVNMQTAKRLLDVGADVLVAGSFVFNAPDPLRTIQELKAL